MRLSETLIQLSDRLPELAWQLQQSPIPFSRRLLPEGLFKIKHPFDSSALIEDIQSDIEKLKTQDSEIAIRYLAEHIHRKIDILVKLCHIYRPNNTPSISKAIDITQFMTRQSWFQAMNTRVNQLKSMKKALEQRIAEQIKTAQTVIILELSRELALVEKELTEVSESLAQA